VTRNVATTFRSEPPVWAPNLDQERQHISGHIHTKLAKQKFLRQIWNNFVTLQFDLGKCFYFMQPFQVSTTVGKDQKVYVMLQVSVPGDSSQSNGESTETKH